MDKFIKIRYYKDKLFKAGIVLFTSIAILPLLLIIFYILKKGISSIHWSFLVNLPKPVGEVGGGISNAIVGTIILILHRFTYCPCLLVSCQEFT